MVGVMEVEGAICGFKETVDTWGRDTCTPPIDPTTAGPGGATPTGCVGGARDCGGACWGAWGGGGGRGGP